MSSAGASPYGKNRSANRAFKSGSFSKEGASISISSAGELIGAARNLLRPSG
jgi:hypothetical protein